MTSIPYRMIRLVAGAAAVLMSVYVFASKGAIVPAVLGLAVFVSGWYLAHRFARAGASDATAWLDTVLPFGIGLFAILPAVLVPLLGELQVDVGIAIVLPLFAGMALSLAFGPYADQKVAFGR